ELRLKNKEDELTRYRTEVGKLNVQLEKLIAQISSELKVAHMIQRVLVPTEIPSIPGFEFSTKFVASSVQGGDFYDLFEMEDRFRFGMFLSSSSGHGMSALFLSVLLKLMAQTEARKGTNPKNLIELMRKEIIPTIQGNEETSLFYGIVDRRNFDLQYCALGKIYGWVWNHTTQNANALHRQPHPFRKDFSNDITVHSASLNPRDRVLLLSEGVVLMKNPDNEPFGEERVKQILLAHAKAGVHDIRNEILFQTQRFSQKSELPRDATVILAEVKDRVLRIARDP
ncbi:MAG: SpoIIE family protein phosphatase, partial [Bdellovibrionales bacterium]|nr:SpoIIE family protein phosphatase [Bdellovibrionales bacterium]